MKLTYQIRYVARRRWRQSVLLLAVGVPLAAAAAQAPRPPGSASAVLQGLDKVTARISTIDAPLGRPVRFGTLAIVVRACHKRPPTEPPESAAFLEIDDNKPGGERARVFSGWMFASSPALSALEHAVYDVWVVDCRNASNAAAPNAG